MLEGVKCALGTVNAHFGADVNATACDLWNVLHPFHVCGVAAGSKDDSDLGLWIHIVRSDERPSRVVDQRCQLNMELLRCLLSRWLRPDKEVQGRTYFSSDFLNISATSRPSVFGAPKPFVHLMSSP